MQVVNLQLKNAAGGMYVARTNKYRTFYQFLQWFISNHYRFYYGVQLQIGIMKMSKIHMHDGCCYIGYEITIGDKDFCTMEQMYKQIFCFHRLCTNIGVVWLTKVGDKFCYKVGSYNHADFKRWRNQWWKDDYHRSDNNIDTTVYGDYTAKESWEYGTMKPNPCTLPNTCFN